MKLALIGYGKMGKAIEKIALERGHEVTAKIASGNIDNLSKIKCDVAIEFTSPEAAYNNVQYCVENNIPVISGTTGWSNKKEEIEKLTKSCNGTFFYASNFSIGVNIMFRLNQYLAQMMRNENDYGVSIEEIHHTAKKDAPSGTAITLADDLIAQNQRLIKWVDHPTESKSELTIKSLRIDQIPGTHTVKYSSAIDDIEIKHTAHSREGFARGVVLVAEWLPGKTGVLSMNDFMPF